MSKDAAEAQATGCLVVLLSELEAAVTARPSLCFFVLKKSKRSLISMFNLQSKPVTHGTPRACTNPEWTVSQKPAARFTAEPRTVSAGPGPAPAPTPASGQLRGPREHRKCQHSSHSCPRSVPPRGRGLTLSIPARSCHQQKGRSGWCSRALPHAPCAQLSSGWRPPCV